MTIAATDRPQPRTVTGKPRPHFRKRRRANLTATVILIIGGLSCILPALWILVAATKSNAQLFSTAPYVPSLPGAFWSNMSGILTYNHEIFLRWWLNSVIYAVGGGVLSTAIAGAAGYALGQ